MRSTLSKSASAAVFGHNRRNSGVTAVAGTSRSGMSLSGRQSKKGGNNRGATMLGKSRGPGTVSMPALHATRGARPGIAVPGSPWRREAASPWMKERERELARAVAAEEYQSFEKHLAVRRCSSSWCRRTYSHVGMYFHVCFMGLQERRTPFKQALLAEHRETMADLLSASPLLAALNSPGSFLPSFAPQQKLKLGKEGKPGQYYHSPYAQR